MEYNKISFEGNVWKVDTNHEWLVAEVRNGDTREVEIAGIDLNEQKLVWKQPGLDWWESFIGVNEDKIFINTYKDPQFPETKGIKVLNLQNGELEWETNEFSFVEVVKDGVLATAKEEEEINYILLDINSGAVLKGLSEEERSAEGPSEPSSQINTPAVYREGDEYFGQVREFLEQFEKKPVKLIEYLEHDNRILVGLYEQKGESFANSLIMFNDKGELLKEIILYNESNGLGIGTFFVVKELLVFIRDKKEIVILQLNT